MMKGSKMHDDCMSLAVRRYSVRRYLDDPVPREKIERCLEAARLAPSACNSQPWKFIVADTPAARTRLASAAFNGIYRVFDFAARAPVLIALLSERSRYAAALAGRLRDIRYNLVDIGIAGEHLVLQAVAEGLGTCWIGWFNEKGVRKALNLPSGARVDLLISMGYAAGPPPATRVRKPLDAIRCYLD